MCWLQQSAELWNYPTFLLYPLALVACVECFAGFHAWRLLLGLNGAVLGFLAGALVSMLLGASLLVLLGGLVGAMAGAYLFASMASMGSAVLAFSSVASFGILLGRIVGMPWAWYMPLAVIAGIAALVAVLMVPRLMIMTLAAVAGAQQIAAAWSALHLPYNAKPCPDTVIPAEWCLFLVLAAGGLIVQMATTWVLQAPREEVDAGNPGKPQPGV